LSKREASAALKAILKQAPSDVDTMVEASWHKWTQGEELLPESRLSKLAAAVTRYLPASAASVPKQKVPVEDDSGKLEDGHSKTGIVCKCGQIHVRRGDRVRRGAATDPSGDEVPVGQLGSIVGVGENQESVRVTWDRSSSNKVFAYTWPDPEGNVLTPASFYDVADDTCRVQERNSLSSAAAEELLRRANFEETAVDSFSNCEEMLRTQAQLYQRVRLLPDKGLVQQWFDRVTPCLCSRPACSGGVQWSSRAEKHLGREGLVLKIDSSDDTVLVATAGACNCKIWYPRLAVTPVFDPDLDDKPLFQESSRVECRMDNGWEKGVVKQVCWNGPSRTGPCPYLVTLDSGGSICVPHVNLIRAA
jgi:hypothetical protein